MKNRIIILFIMFAVVFVLMIATFTVPARPIEKLDDGVLYRYHKTYAKFGIDKKWTVYDDGTVTYSVNGLVEHVQLTSTDKLRNYINQQEYDTRLVMLYQWLFIDQYDCTDCVFMNHLINYNGTTYAVFESDFLRRIIQEIEQTRLET